MRDLTAPLAWAAAFVLALALLAAGDAGAAEAARAGDAVAVAGRVTVARGGRIFLLSKGDPVVSGDIISTGPGASVQLRFADGSRVYLREESRFHVEAFRAAGAGEESMGIFSLVKGALRTVTGWIGHRPKSVYRMKTALATIGIRGTDYELKFDPLSSDLWIGVTPDTDSEIVVENGAGSFVLRAGEYGYLGSPREPLVRLPIRPPELGKPPEMCD